MNLLSAPPRLVPERPLPPYAHVPGRTPHPLSDPRGHRYGVEQERPQPPDPERWQECRPYLFGIDLFNHGYYWEAHEEWEGLWHACGRSGRTADFLKGLIKLAAAGVKVREGKPEGVRHHARRAQELFRGTTSDLGTDSARFLGLRLDELIRHAGDVAEQPPRAEKKPENVTEMVFDFRLLPAEQSCR
jgi:hypothetical protein